jgi:NAD(P)-dependent dehydrogenase (short-subunit alcohol dehydrogenase family)
MSGKRVCLFTGASGRLGTAFCSSSANEYDIVAVYRRRPPAWTQTKENFHPILTVQADLTIASDQRRVVEIVLARFGRIDLLVNSAVHSVWASMLETNRSIDSASAQFQLNVIVPLQLSVLCARNFWRDRKIENLEENRNIINVSSIAGSRVYPKLGQGVYAASKAALDQLSRHMADEFSAIGVRVNALAPNSFPRILSTPAVIQSLKKLDQGTMTGRVLIVDRQGETLEYGFRPRALTSCLIQRC